MEEYKAKEIAINYMAYFIELGTHKTPNGNKVKTGKCPICNTYFGNHRSYLNHIRSTPKHTPESFLKLIPEQTLTECISNESIDSLEIPERIQPKCSLSEEEVNLCKFLCTCAIPLNIVTKSEFQNLMDNVKFQNVSRSKARTLLLRYSSYLSDLNYFEIHGKRISIISDGGTLNGRKFYVIAALTPQKSYFLDILEMEETDTKSLLREFSPIIKRVLSEECEILCFCTDNGSNLKALTRASDTHSIQQKFGIKAFRVSCCIHTGNLTLKDVAKASLEYSNFQEGISTLLTWLRKNKSICNAEKIEGKIPSIQTIKWKTYTGAALFLIKNQSKINNVLNKLVKKNPPIRAIPEVWIDICQILAPLDSLITICQKDRTLMSEFFSQQLKLIDSWKEMISSNAYAKIFIDSWNNRFIKTADLSIGKLAYILTRKGRIWFKNIRGDGTPSTEFLSQYSYIKERMKQFAQYLKVETDTIDRLFDNYLSCTFQYDDREALDFWEEQQIKNHSYYVDCEKKSVSWKGFSMVAIILVQLPSTEALCERVFSHLTCLFPMNRLHSRTDLIHAQTIIRMYHNLNKEC